MPIKYDVFISSTSDLKEERYAIKDKLKEERGERLRVFLYEEIAAQGVSPKEFCQQTIADSRMFICILGGKYGSLYPPKYQGSIVKFEFDESKKKPPPHLTAVFCKNLSDTEIEPKQQRFRKKIGNFNGIWKADYSSISELTAGVYESIIQFYEDVVNADAETEEISKIDKSQLILIFSIIFGALGIIIVLACFLFKLSPELIIFSLAIIIVGLLLSLGFTIYICQPMIKK